MMNESEMQSRKKALSTCQSRTNNIFRLGYENDSEYLPVQASEYRSAFTPSLVRPSTAPAMYTDFLYPAPQHSGSHQPQILPSTKRLHPRNYSTIDFSEKHDQETTYQTTYQGSYSPKSKETTLATEVSNGASPDPTPITIKMEPSISSPTHRAGDNFDSTSGIPLGKLQRHSYFLPNPISDEKICIDDNANCNPCLKNFISSIARK